MTPQLRPSKGRPHPEWVVRAACRAFGVDRDAFYPEHKNEPKAATARAKRVCAPCPVRSECRAWGDLISPDWGIFGGLTAAERRARRSHLRGAA